MRHAALEGEGSIGASGRARLVDPATTVGAVLPERVMLGACFLPGTLIQTEEGLRAIETLVAGEWVAGRSEASGKTSWRRVVQTFRTENKEAVAVRVRHADGQFEEIQATTEHPFYVEGKKWCAANELEAGDQVVLLDKSHSTIVSIASLPELRTVYNFEVELDHTYFVGGRGIWVHNTSRIGVDWANGKVVSEVITEYKLIYNHQLKQNKVTDVDDLRIQLSEHQTAMNDIIKAEGMTGLQTRIRNYRADPSIEAEGRAMTKALGSADTGNAAVRLSRCVRILPRGMWQLCSGMEHQFDGEVCGAGIRRLPGQNGFKHHAQHGSDGVGFG